MKSKGPIVLGSQPAKRDTADLLIVFALEDSRALGKDKKRRVKVHNLCNDIKYW